MNSSDNSICDVRYVRLRTIRLPDLAMKEHSHSRFFCLASLRYKSIVSFLQVLYRIPPRHDPSPRAPLLLSTHIPFCPWVLGSGMGHLGTHKLTRRADVPCFLALQYYTPPLRYSVLVDPPFNLFGGTCTGFLLLQLVHNDSHGWHPSIALLPFSLSLLTHPARASRLVLPYTKQLACID